MASPLKDLKTTIHTTTTIYPSEPTKRRSMFLSNIDQALNFHVKAVQFFSANPAYPFESVVERLRSAGERLLVEYDFLAGRLQFGEDGRLEIDCNAAGVGLAVASSKLRLEELGELYPNPVFRQLTPMPELSDDQPICDFQVTKFKCGGFALGGSVNHSAMDALSYYILFLNLATLTTNKPLAMKPISDRKLLAARSPPRVTFPHPDGVKLEAMEQPLTFTSDALQFKLFHLDSNHISFLKERAVLTAGGGGVDDDGVKHATSFNVVAAHLWRCKALAAAAAPDVELDMRTSTLLYAVDIRQKLEPNLPLSFAGNAVLPAYARATLLELGEEGSFARIVQCVGEGKARMSDEYIRSAIDWSEIHRASPAGDVYVTSWWKLGFAGMEYEWGQPSYFCPLPHPGRELIVLFPRPGGEGVNVMVGLPEPVMNNFQHMFHSFLLPQPRL